LFRIVELCLNNFEDVPSPCKHCLYWQSSEDFDDSMLRARIQREKQEWFIKVFREFGDCGFIAYLNRNPIGFVQYAPPIFFPRIEEYTSGSPSRDAVFLACLYIVNRENRGRGFGTAMLEKLLAELSKRKMKAIETFARKDLENNPSGPLALYLKHGFKVEHDKGNYPLVRLEL